MVVTMTVGVLLAFRGQGQGPAGMKGFFPVYNDLSLYPDSVSHRSMKYLCTVLTHSKLPRNAAAVPREGKSVTDFVWRITAAHHFRAPLSQPHHGAVRLRPPPVRRSRVLRVRSPRLHCVCWCGGRAGLQQSVFHPSSSV